MHTTPFRTTTLLRKFLSKILATLCDYMKFEFKLKNIDPLFRGMPKYIFRLIIITCLS